MKFENPIMNISMFDMENIATTASTNFEAAKDNAVADVQTALGSSAEVSSQILEFTF